MTYNNFPYGIFNQSTLTAYENQRMQVQKLWEQYENIATMVKAISDYCEAARKVDSEYRNVAMQACVLELIRQMEIDNRGRQS
jgi:hypothetical protein